MEEILIWCRNVKMSRWNIFSDKIKQNTSFHYKNSLHSCLQVDALMEYYEENDGKGHQQKLRFFSKQIRSFKIISYSFLFFLQKKLWSIL